MDDARGVHLGGFSRGLVHAPDGFPTAWDSRTSAKQRLVLPILVGVTFGICAILIDRITGATSILAAKMGSDFNVGFPGSLFVYTGGAIKLESEFRLIPIPILLWLVSSVLLKGHAQNKIFGSWLC
jgi:hypothetical protein